MNSKLRKIINRAPRLPGDKTRVLSDDDTHQVFDIMHSVKSMAKDSGSPWDITKFSRKANYNKEKYHTWVSNYTPRRERGIFNDVDDEVIRNLTGNPHSTIDSSQKRSHKFLKIASGKLREAGIPHKFDGNKLSVRSSADFDRSSKFRKKIEPNESESHVPLLNQEQYNNFYKRANFIHYNSNFDKTVHKLPTTTEIHFSKANHVKKRKGEDPHGVTKWLSDELHSHEIPHVYEDNTLKIRIPKHFRVK